MTKDYVLGLDIGGTNVRMGLVDRSYKAHCVEVVSSRAMSGSGNTIKALTDSIRDYLERNAGDKEIIAVSAGFPSVIDRDRKKIFSSTNLTGIDGVDVPNEFFKALNIKTVIEHDAYYLLLYDMISNKIETEGAVMGIYFGAGLGNAMYINGRPYIGKHGTACELGHLAVPGGTRKCSCGNIGCIEMYSCGKALERIAEEKYPETKLSDIFLMHADDAEMDSFVDHMAIAVSAELNIMDPDCMFIGGGLVNMKGFPKEKLLSYVYEHTRKPYPADDLNIKFSDNFPEKGIIGAAMAVFN